MDYEDKELREFLEELYWDKKMSLYEIAENMKCPYSTVQQTFARLKIPRRTLKNSMRLAWKTGRIKYVEGRVNPL